MFYPRSEGPPSGGVPEGGARPAFPRWRPQRSLGRCGNPLVGHYDPAARSIAARCPGGNARARKRGPASENRRWSAERRASLIAKGRGRLARARHVLAPRARGPRKPPRLSALRRPSSGGGKEKQNPGATTRRGNEETWTGLFDIVNRKRGGNGVQHETSARMGQSEHRRGTAQALAAQWFCSRVPLSRGCGAGTLGRDTKARSPDGVIARLPRDHAIRGRPLSCTAAPRIAPTRAPNGARAASIRATGPASWGCLTSRNGHAAIPSHKTMQGRKPKVAQALGAPILRKEDPALLSGRGRYADDLPVPAGTLHAHVIRSPRAHAKIVSIDAAAAMAQDGVWAVITGEDVRKISDPFLIALKAPVNQWSLAVERVR